MKTSISYWQFDGGLEGKLSLESAMTQAKAAGFDAIELCIFTDGALTDTTTQEQCQAIVGLAKKIGIEISSVASGENWTTRATAPDPAVRQQCIDFTKKALQVTAWLGLDCYLYVPGAVDVFFLPEAEVVPYDVCMGRAKDTMKQLISTAEKVGVTIGVENVWNKFLLSPLEMRDFIDSFGSKRVGAYFDVGNVLLTGYPDHWIRILGKRIARVHIKDFAMAKGTVEGFVDLGEGDVDFPAVLAALKDVGYDGYCTSEILPFAPGRIEKTAEQMKKIFTS